MRITRIDIDGFGVWQGLRLDDLAPGLNVFHGPNEAGKTTLLELVRSVLFGFSADRRSRYLPPVRGGRAGGRLQVTAGDERYELARFADEGTDLQQGALRVLGPTSTTSPEAVFRTLLHGLDERVYSNVFAVGLQDLQELGTLSGTEASDLLFKLAAGLDRVSLVDVLNDLDASRERLAPSRPGATVTPRIVELAQRRKRLQADLEQARRQGVDYANLATERTRVEAEAARREADRAAVQAELRRADLATVVRPIVAARAKLEAERSALPAARADVALHLKEWQKLGAERKRFAKLRAEARVQAERIEAQVTALGFRPQVWRQAPRLEAMLEQEHWLASMRKQATLLESEAQELVERVRAEQRDFKLPEKSKPGDGQKITPELLARLAPLAEARHAAREREKTASAAAEHAQAAAQGLVSELRGGGRSNGRDFVSLLGAAGERVTKLRRRTQLDERLEDLTQTFRDLEDQASEWLDRQVLSGGVLLALGAMIVLGLVMLGGSALGFLLTDTWLGQSRGALLVLGAVLVACGVLIKRHIEHNAAERLEESQDQLDEAEREIAEAKQERDALDADLPPGGGPLLVRLQAAEKELSELESLAQLDVRHQAAHGEAESAAELAQRAQAEHAAARDRWRAALAVAHLPAELTLSQLRDWSRRTKEWGVLAERAEERRREARTRQEELAALGQRLRGVTSELGLRVEHADEALLFAGLRAELDKQRDLAAERQKLRKQWRQFHQEERRLRGRGGLVKQRMLAVLAQCGVADETELRRHVELVERGEQLKAEIARLDAAIRSALGDEAPEDSLRDLLALAEPEAAALRGEALRTSQRLDSELKQLYDRNGQLAQELRAQADDLRPATMLLELGMIEQQLREAIERWQVLAVTHRALESLRQKVERDRQPRTLREASVYFERMTEGRYTRVWTPLAERTLCVNDAAGRPVAARLLSQGTRELLYLSLRLALVQHFAERGADLPCVMDDILVNLDQARAKAAATVLRDFAAEGRQVFVFTCHEHIVKLFRQLRVTTRDLPSNGEAPALALAALAVEAPAAETPPEPIAEPAPEPPRRTAKPPKRLLKEPPPAAPPALPQIAPAPPAWLYTGPEDYVPEPEAEPERYVPPRPITRGTNGRQPHPEPAPPVPVPPVVVAAPQPVPTVEPPQPVRPSSDSATYVRAPLFGSARWQMPVADDVAEPPEVYKRPLASTSGMWEPLAEEEGAT